MITNIKLCTETVILQYAIRNINETVLNITYGKTPAVFKEAFNASLMQSLFEDIMTIQSCYLKIYQFSNECE